MAVISGKVFDQNSGEALIGATIYEEVGMAGASTNAHGYYSLKYDPYASALITVSFIGYESRSFMPDSISAIKNIYLSPATRELGEVVVTSGKSANVQKAQTSAFMVNKTELLTLPSLASEPDLNLYLQLTPGVSFAGDGNSNLYVRGGGHDQNLFLLDDMPLFHVSHFGGFFSTFNADIINSAILYKGGFPARHGGRLSSVVDVHTYDGDLYKFNGKLTLGLLFSKIAINGPISKGKSSYNISFRKNLFNYLDLLSDANIDFGFYDANIKLSAALSDVDKLYLSFYAGNDLFGFHDGTDSTGFSKNNTTWGNLAASVRYNRIFSPSLFGNFIIGHSDYHFNEYRLMKLDSVSEDERVHYENDFKSDISCEFAKAHFEWNIRNNVRLFYGYELNWYRYNPGNAHIIQKFPGLENAEGDYGYKKSYSIENNLFSELIFEGVHGFSGNIGIRPSLLSIDNKSFLSFQPRLSLSYSLFKNLEIKTSFTRINQAFHVLTSTGTGFSSDYRIPVFDMAPPSESEQFVIGLEYKPLPGCEISLEAYSKYMDQMVMKKPGVRYTVDYSSWEKTIETGGKGMSEGLELLIRKTTGRFTGWVGLTWQSGRRYFENINNGNPFPFDYDRTWEVNCSGQYPINENMNLGLNWIYATGIPANIPEWYFEDIEGNSVFLYKGYNSSRQRDYHRLDLSLSMKGDHGDWNISIMNVYYHKNPYYYQVTIRNDKPELKEHNLFTIIPTFSYTFKF
ncbi:MAG: TonB-dependent receptor [Prolixibacteraceae bacterium]|nr:TonB-dependent receptor [Prolixibacteraceae bacterium]